MSLTNCPETKDYILKSHSLSAGVLDEAEALRFLETIENLHALKAGDMGRLNVRADLAQRPATGLNGYLRSRLRNLRSPVFLPRQAIAGGGSVANVIGSASGQFAAIWA